MALRGARELRMHSTGLLCVTRNLRCQLGYRSELAFITDTMQELDAHRRTIQLHIHIEQMRLNAEGLIPEECIVPYVCHPWVEAFFPLHTHGIHAFAWHNGIDRADIGRGEPQLSAAPKALHDGACDGIIAPQKTRRLSNVAGEQEATNIRAADHGITLHNGRNHGDLIAKVFGLGLEKVHRPGATMPKAKIVPDHHLVNAETSPQDLTHKFKRLLAGKLLGKRHPYTNRNPERGNQADFLRIGGQQGWRFLRRQYL